MKRNYLEKTQRGSNLLVAKQSRDTSRGFSLVELLVVIAIIGVLVTIVIVAIDPLTLIRDSRDARRRTDLQAIRTALQIYFNEQRSYPISLPAGESCWSIPAGCGVGDTVIMRQVPSNFGDDYQYEAQNCAAGPAEPCTDYRAGVDLENPPGGDDDNTITKCGAFGTVEYAVCND